MWDVLKGFLAVVGGFFLSVGILNTFVGKDDDGTPVGSSRQNFATEKQEAMTAAVSVSAAALADAYEANSVAADMRFKGQRLRIFGRVNSISTNLFDEAVIELESSQFLSPQATLAKSQKSRAAHLQTGQMVTLLCVGAGDVVKMPMLKDCSFL